MTEPGGDAQIPEGASRPEHIPSQRDIAIAYRGIRNHNRNYTGTGAVLRNKRDAFDAEEAGVTLQSDTLAQKDFEREASAGLIGLTDNELFTRIGLKIGRFGTQTDVEEIARQYETTGKAQLVPIVDNLELFKEFLSTLKPADAIDKNDNNEDVAVLLQDVVNTLQKTVSLGYRPPEDVVLHADDRQTLKDKGDEALRIFTEIDPIYRDRLHVRDEKSNQMYLNASLPSNYERRMETFISNYRILEKAERYWGMNVLPEYIEGLPYLTPPDESTPGPANWHIYRSAPYWDRRQWRDALAFLKRMDSDERTRTFGHEVRDSLISGVTAAIGETDKIYSFREYKADLVNIRNFLTGEQYDQAQLNSYTSPPSYPPDS